MNNNRIYGVAGVVAVIALAVGGAGGYVFGVQRGRADGERQLEVKEQGHRERNAEAEAEIKRLKNFVAHPQVAIFNPQPVVIEPEPARVYDNDKLIEFFDDPNKHEGKELTVLLRYRAVPGQAEGDLKSQLRWQNSQNQDSPAGTRRASATFNGSSSSGASIKINLGVPEGVEVPAAKDGDPLLITMKCLVIRVAGYTEPTGLCSKIVRPR